MKIRVLVTGGAGFIGSNICEKLLANPAVELVRVIDNLITGSKDNLADFISNPKFEFVEGDIRDYDTCLKVTKDTTAILHQAALGSVPRSIQNPIMTNEYNVTGTLNVFTAAKENKVKKIAFASSSSTYGSNKDLPKVEKNIGAPLSPYAVTKLVSELYAKVFADLYDFHYVGFRYFNVFGPRQNPKGPYAAVIPIFFKETMDKKSPTINGDGEQSRDFTYVENVVDVNIGTLFNDNPASWNHIYNVAYGAKTSLNQLYYSIAALTGYEGKPIYGPDRAGDIRDSLADTSKAIELLKFNPLISIQEGLEKTYQWYLQHPEFFK